MSLFQREGQGFKSPIPLKNGLTKKCYFFPLLRQIIHYSNSPEKKDVTRFQKPVFFAGVDDVAGVTVVVSVEVPEDLSDWESAEEGF